VLEAADGNERLRFCRQHEPDLMLLDIFMSVMDGLEVLRNLRIGGPSVKVIANSMGSVEIRIDGYLQVAESLGAIRSLRKPMEPAALLKAVEETLREVE
jgi:CheY-like chemotaxis protein